MTCSLCGGKSVYGSLCRDHFIEHFERVVEDTIEDYNLISSDDKVCVAASGGKDSLTLLFILNKLGFDVTALVIDEGISDYREHTINDLEFFCRNHGVKLMVASFVDEFGVSLDELIRRSGRHACSVCGILRRYLINKYARGFDILATGHNADDEAQAVLMNLFKAHPFFFKGGPSTGVGSSPSGFVQRVKPLYFCTEKEVMTYALLNNIRVGFSECPNIVGSFRSRVRDSINNLLSADEKRNILRKFLDLKSLVVESSSPSACSRCGAPSSGDLCAACSLLDELGISRP